MFNLPQHYSLDMAQLDAAYREVQATVHPDKFVQAGDAEKRVAMQWATRANEAYQTLKKPLKRASYLCELNGVDLQSESNTSMPAAFLMQQMEWREAFDDARHAEDGAALETLETQVRAALKTQLEAAGQALDAGDFTQAAQIVRTCMFLEKFIADIAAYAD
ncbi:Fe-S protein assembly co-chaperone HscB [Undibacterium sp.]|uniref:Fe-S protein assembly co-chaperone HscB n=1 Tax=Undibacterium sp. TaxID=1914977 RepID=UPI00374D6BF0